MRAGTKKTLSILLTFLAVWLSARLLMPLLLPFVLGAALALAAEPLTSLFCRRMHLPRPVSTGIAVSMSFCLVVLLVLVAAAFVLRELKALAGVLPDLEQTARTGICVMEDWLLQITSRTPQSIQPLLQQNVANLFSDGTRLLDKTTSWLLGLAGTMLTHVPDSALSIGTAVISGYMISAKLPRIRRWIRIRIPRERLKAIVETLSRVRKAVGSWLYAQAKLAGITWMLLTLGFILLRVRYAPLWALAVAAVDAFPVLGTGTVLVPWAIVSLLQNNVPRAAGLLGLYLTVALARSVLEPKLLGKSLGLDPLVTLIAMYTGYKIWGIAGMLLSPLLAVTAIQMVPESSTGES